MRHWTKGLLRTCLPVGSIPFVFFVYTNNPRHEAVTQRGNQIMNRQKSITSLVGLACACLILIVCQTYAADSKAGGHLIVQRSANFGQGVNLILSVDGKHLAEVGDGRTYDGYLPAGQHVLVAMGGPERGDQVEVPLKLTVKDGETYSYIAGWQGGNVVLSKNQ